jgi:regulator of replication initiation timing
MYNSINGSDSKLIEEKLGEVSDLKTQIRCLITDNEDVKLNQEELNANVVSLSHQGRDHSKI